MTVCAHSKTPQSGKTLFLFLLLLFSLCFATGCKKSVSYIDYVSELRSNVFLAKNEEFSLRIYAVKKESPYVADGIPEASTPRLEAYLVAPDGTQTVEITFQIGSTTVGGEMSYDNVKCEYFYSATMKISDLYAIPCRIRYGETEVELTANSVRTERTLTPSAALAKLQEHASELFTSLTDKYGFAGEIHLRLLYEDAPYYYIGVIDRTGKIYAFLMNAETGKVLARRES